jgi:ABC-2 type transport system ATP-binding protein
MITGALDPDAGAVRVFGLDPSVDGEQVRTRCGVVSAKPALYDRLSGHDNLLYSAQLYEVDGPSVERRIADCAARFGIDAALGQQVGGYSTGMKTRLALARAILHDPDLLLFDEPTSGLDPESAHAVLEMIRQMADDGRTVVMCTHLLAEAEGLADHIVMMEDGAALCAGTHEDLAVRYWPGSVVVLEAEVPAHLDRVANLHGVLSMERRGATRVALDGFGRVPDLVASLVADGVRLTRVEPLQPTLEDLYFAIRATRQDAPRADATVDAGGPDGDLPPLSSTAVRDPETDTVETLR